MASVLSGAFALAALLATGSAGAQTYPAKPIRLVVPFPPAGAVDIIGRIVAVPLSERLKQQVVIDNRSGANAIIGTEIVSHATPDGYTILIVPAGHAINPSAHKKLPFDTVRDFTPIGLIGHGAYLLVCNSAVPAKNVRELIAWLKSQPGKVPFAASGVGNATHLAAELFASMAGTPILPVFYKGGGPALNDLLGGQVQLFFATVASSVGHLRGGKIRAIAVSTLKRATALPDIPTVAESGLPGYEVDGWYGLLAPARTPRAIVERLNRELSDALNNQDLRDKLTAAGVDARSSTPQELGDIVARDIDKWAKLIQSSGMRLGE